MLRKKIISISICFFTSVAIVYGLFIWSEYYNNRPGSFIRYFEPHSWKSYISIDLTYNSWYIAGVSDKRIYLGNGVAPASMLSVTYQGDTTQFYLTMVQGDSVPLVAPKLFVSDSMVYCYDGPGKKIFSGSIPIFCLARPDTLALRFNGFLALRKGIYFLRQLNDSLQENVIVKEEIGGGTREMYVPEKQQDGIFSVDGIMDFDPSTQKLIYAYFYRNQFLALDTNLQIIGKFNTIDTNTVAKIKVAGIASQNITTLAEPSGMVNKRISVNRDTLYVLSAQRARNQPLDQFRSNATIDLYRLRDGKYLKTIYLPNLYGLVKAFKVADRHIIALYDHHLVVYGQFNY